MVFLKNILHNKMQSRKFIYAMTLSGVSSVAVISNFATVKDWIEINKFLFATYIGANVIQKAQSLDIKN